MSVCSVPLAILQFSLASAQTATFALVMLGFLIAHMWWRPYESRSFFLAELGSMACLLVTAILATLAQGSASGAPVALQDAAGITMICVNIATVLALAWLYAHTFLGAHRGTLVRAWLSIRRRSASLGCTCCRRFDGRSATTASDEASTEATRPSSTAADSAAASSLAAVGPPSASIRPQTQMRPLVYRVAALADDSPADIPHSEPGLVSAAGAAPVPLSRHSHEELEGKATAKAAHVVMGHPASARLSAAFLSISNTSPESASFAAQATASGSTSRRVAAAPLPLQASSL